MTPPARTLRERKLDTLNRLEHDVDAWVATANPALRTPYLIPLSFLWDGATLLFATPTANPTAGNLWATGKVRVGVGLTRDVILSNGTVQMILPASEMPEDIGDAFVAKTGFDPRQLTTPYIYFRVRPQRLWAWRESNELEGRELMRDGQWLIPD